MGGPWNDPKATKELINASRSSSGLIEAKSPVMADELQIEIGNGAREVKVSKVDQKTGQGLESGGKAPKKVLPPTLRDQINV